MKRRHFIALSSAALVVPALARATPALDYTPGLADQRLKAGETVFLDFKAEWCTTCRAQERVIGALLAENPAYGQAITFINIDWDDHKRDPLTKRLAIPRRSTLVVLKGDQELGRIVAGTRKDDIKALLDTALQAAAV
ncbi:thioredoxin family protein [Actibacterium sp. 188UL27-1]|uniref:thioredoxin family protein n=1 Tax=Actibacterium sp. 188UL27-1 TaxID=2786961 RepID=UPI00195ECAF4|nr:thioredoxin family protein [Actibacterium sp. 188UL27-1]MBM7068997.1 thioredoxin family protein [Actibacterium sp. 188UL27-1]